MAKQTKDDRAYQQPGAPPLGIQPVDAGDLSIPAELVESTEPNAAAAIVAGDITPPLDPKQQRPAPPAERPRQPANEDRHCPYHKLALRANKTEPFFTRYYCPEVGCTYSEKVPRPNVRRRVEQYGADEQNFSAR